MSFRALSSLLQVCDESHIIGRLKDIEELDESRMTSCHAQDSNLIQDILPTICAFPPLAQHFSSKLNTSR